GHDRGVDQEVVSVGEFVQTLPGRLVDAKVDLLKASGCRGRAGVIGSQPSRLDRLGQTGPPIALLLQNLAIEDDERKLRCRRAHRPSSIWVRDPVNERTLRSRT